jgi:hypothetical protein
MPHPPRRSITRAPMMPPSTRRSCAPRTSLQSDTRGGTSPGMQRRAASQVKNYFAAPTGPMNVPLSGASTCEGVGAAGEFGCGSEVFWRTSCSAVCSSISGEGATTAVGAIKPEACASGAGASQPNCSDQFANTPLAASPYDCQLEVAATPRENAITKRKMVRPRCGLLDTRAFSRSCLADICSDGGMPRLGENGICVELTMELIDTPFSLI